MAHVTVSKKYQVVIPQKIREALGIQKGQQLIVFVSGGRIELVPDREIADMEGIFPGMSLEGIREEAERL